ncbi:hypothetical protein D5F12_24105 [Serratia marcescens]|nr:hypothetical protein D4G80_24095 [Serratia marcescens]RXG74371.1 hypothetical protein D5F12_24105 [Serratia marcescens]
MIALAVSCRKHHSHYNKQPYSHVVKLPDDGFQVIRLSGLWQLSGSVPRRKNNPSAVVGQKPPLTITPVKHNI